MLTIHMGLAKAGSTSIQSFLMANAEALGEQGMIYPEAGRRDDAHPDLAMSIRDGAPSPAWTEVLRLAETQSVIVSSEGFSLIDPHRLAEVLGPVKPKILCWARNAPAALVSFYIHAVRRRQSAETFDEYFARTVDRRYYLAGKTLSPWVSEFGADNVRVRSLDREVLSDGDLSADVLDALQISDDSNFVRTAPQNIAPGWRALELVRAFNGEVLAALADGKAKGRKINFVTNLLPRAIARAEDDLGLFERGVYLTPAQARDLAHRYDEDIALLARLGVDASMKALRLNDVPAAENPSDGLTMPPELESRLLRATIVRLASMQILGGESSDQTAHA